jgi:uncharacterized Ntn-hydrolase superfamily protein
MRYMTFALTGRCPRTGQIGVVVVSPAMAVGARTAHCAAGVGAVITQHRTDPRLGPRGLDLLRAGRTAQETIDTLVATSPHIQWRQIAALDAAGSTAIYSGARTRPEMSEVAAQDACAVGNSLVSARATPAMLLAFQADPAAPLAERLVCAAEAGLATGGEQTPAHSAHLLVVEQHSFPLIDLRVDWHDRPVTELRALWVRYAPLAIGYVTRAIDPDHPSIR